MLIPEKKCQKKFRELFGGFQVINEPFRGGLVTLNEGRKNELENIVKTREAIHKINPNEVKL